MPAALDRSLHFGPVEEEPAVRSPIRPRGPARRRGSYTVLFGVMIVTILGFGALAVDVSWVRLAQSQAQDVADAASQAALIQLKRTGSADAALHAAEEVVARNTVAGHPATLQEFELGTWNDGDFTVSAVNRNAVRAQVGRTMDMLLAPLFGWFVSDVRAEAISANRTLHVVLAVDITNSWCQQDFEKARAAAVRFLEVIGGAHGPHDLVGMTVFTGRFGVEHTPMRLISDALFDGTYEDWANLRTASKAGTMKASFGACGSDNGCTLLTGTNQNNFAMADCYPNMWREFRDESGTDHAVGLDMARQMFQTAYDPAAYRALIVLTDGNPNTVGAHTQRGAYQETRWNYIKTPKARSSEVVKSDSQLLAREMHEQDEVDIWAVSFVADAYWMEDVAQGSGYYVRTHDADALVPIFEDIAESLPLAIVR